jgi:hypothetical protein
MTNKATKTEQIRECKKSVNAAARRHKKQAHKRIGTEKAFATMRHSVLSGDFFGERDLDRVHW